MKKEFCIMLEDGTDNFRTKRNRFYSERHEIFFGTANRKKSIEDGLVVFLHPEIHRGEYGVHGKYGHQFDLDLKRKGQQRWQKYYNKTKEDFIARYGKSYI